MIYIRFYFLLLCYGFITSWWDIYASSTPFLNSFDTLDELSQSRFIVQKNCDNGLTNWDLNNRHPVNNILKFAAESPFDNTSSSDQVMAWRRKWDKLLLAKWWRLVTPIFVTVLSRHLLNLQLVACLTPSHYLDEVSLFANHNPRNKLLWDLNEKKKKNCISRCRLQNLCYYVQMLLCLLGCASGDNFMSHQLVHRKEYRQTSNISRTKSQHLNVSRPILQLS